jgi:hypothetical protein
MSTNTQSSQTLQADLIWQTIWDDINAEVEALPVTSIKYDAGALSNKLYEIIDDKAKLRRTLLKNKIIGLYKDLSLIQSHRETIENDRQLTIVIKQIFFSQTELSSLDKIFVNAYYRRILRARLEQDHLKKKITADMMIVGIKEVDKCLRDALGLFWIICKYLGIASTTTPSSFNRSKLDDTTFWAPVSEKLLQLFGENRIKLIEPPEENTTGSQHKNSLAKIMEQNHLRSGVFVMLNIAFNGWSGSVLMVEGDIITVVPATYITRMVTKLL